MKVLWLSWKDRSHPAAGGAETVSGEIMDRLVRDGHEVRLFTSKYKNANNHDTINGVEIFRSGNRFTVYAKARKLYKKTADGWPDIIVDEMNTIPFAAYSYNKTKNVLLCYQLAREVWLHQIMFPLSIIGYFSEPFMLRFLSKKYDSTVTESESTQKDLEKYGFSNIKKFRIGMALTPVETLPEKVDKNLILSLGAIRPMKRTLDAIKAFEIARDTDSKLTMVIAGDDSSKYAKSVHAYVKKSRHAAAINIKGRVSASERIKLMRDASLILVTSVKEGWGLIVTEANSQGTPAVVYSTHGLRDSVQDQKTGVLVDSGNFSDMGKAILTLLADADFYNSIRHQAWLWSKQFTFENSYSDFLKILNSK